MIYGAGLLSACSTSTQNPLLVQVLLCKEKYEFRTASLPTLTDCPFARSQERGQATGLSLVKAQAFASSQPDPLTALDYALSVVQVIRPV